MESIMIDVMINLNKLIHIFCLLGILDIIHLRKLLKVFLNLDVLILDYLKK